MISTPIIRRAQTDEIPSLTALMQASVRLLNIQDYSQDQVTSALEHIFGIDDQLIKDGTYYVAEVGGEIAGCGGWSYRTNLYGGSHHKDGVVPAQTIETDDAARIRAAKIRAFFVHPHYARQGIGRRLMQNSERAARQAGFRRLELLATLTGKRLYLQCGYTPVKNIDLVLPDGVCFPAIQMEKRL